MTAQQPSLIPTTVHDLGDVMRALRAIRKEFDRCLPVYGTWVPTIRGITTAGTNTYSVQNGVYVKTDRLVHFKLQIIMTAKDAAMAGNTELTLPFTAANDVSDASLTIGRFKNVDLAAGYTQLAGVIGVNTSAARLWSMGDNVDSAMIGSGSIAADSRFYASGWYVTAPGN